MKILVLLSRFPYPLEKGDKLRAYQHLRHMKASGHEVHLVALTDEKVAPENLNIIRGICTSVEVIPLSATGLALNLASSVIRQLPLQVGYFYSMFIKRRIKAIAKRINPDLVYCQLIRMAWYAKNIEGVARVIDYQDAFSRGTLQRRDKSSGIYKPVFEREYRLVKKFETESYKWFHRHLIISEQDRQAMNMPDHVNITVVPNGIDTDVFRPTGDSKVFDITFVGHMNYPPNIDSAVFLVKEIMPVVWKEIPGAKVQIAGANPGRKVRELSSHNVTVTGWVNDIRDCYARSRIFIAPMRFGTGLQNKLLEAMAMAVPCITTTLSFTPLNAEKNKDIMVGDKAPELAGHIIKLLTDPDHAEMIAKNGYYFVTENYSLEHSRLQLEAIFNEAIENFRSNG